MSAISRLAAAVTLCAASLSAVAEEAPRYNQVSLHAEVSQQVAHDLMQVTLYSENQGSDPAKLAAETTSVLNAAVADARKVKGVTISLGSRNSYPVYDDKGQKITGWRERAFLRQDPDVIMVGEIRDLETAEIAIKAAQTGHMVMSTLHTNSAAETLTRLLNMGVPAFNLATSVNLIIAQRLARKLCSHCKKEHDVPKETLLHEGFPEELIGTFKLYSPVGCENCKGGYKGRVGIYEVVKNTPALQRIIMEEGNSIEIAEQARKEGFNDLRTSGLLKAMQGITSLEEVNRVTKD